MTSFTVSFWMMSSLQNLQVAFSFLSVTVRIDFEISNSGAPGLCFDMATANCR